MQTCKYIYTNENGSDGGPKDKEGTQISQTMLLNFTNANMVFRLPTITTKAHVPDFNLS